MIEWHKQGLLPLGKQLTDDPRCRLVHGDFFAMSHSADGFDPIRRAAASMRCWWISIIRRETCCIRAMPRSTSRRGWRGLPRICIPAAFLHCGRTTRRMPRSNIVLAGAFATSAAHVVTFDNLRGDHDASNTVYVGVKADLPMPKATLEAAPSAG